MKAYLILLLILFNSCSEEVGNNKNKIFSNYLESSFSDHQSTEKHYYFIILNFGCMNWANIAIEDFNRLAIKKNVTLIIGDTSSIHSELNAKIANWKRNVLIDKAGKINRLNLGLGGAGLIELENNTVKNVYNAGDEEYYKILHEIN